MRAYIVEWFTAEPYESYSGILKVFDSYEKAERFIKEMGTGPHEVNDENFDPGYFIRQNIESYEIE